MRTSRAPASRSSCIASLLVGVFPFVGGPGEKPMGKTLRPLIARIWSEVTVTTEPVCAGADCELASKRRVKNARQSRDQSAAQGNLILEGKSGAKSASSNKARRFGAGRLFRSAGRPGPQK